MGEGLETKQVKATVASTGVAYVDAVGLCELYEIDPSLHRQAFEAWETKLAQLNLEPEAEASGGSVWIPLVFLAPFLVSVGAEEAAKAHQVPGRAMAEKLGSRYTAAVAHVRNQFRWISEALPAG